MSQKYYSFFARYWIFLSVLSITLSFIVISFANPPDKDNAERGEVSKQTIWWHSDEVIKNAVVSAITLKMTRTELSNEVEFRDHFSNIVDLLLLFDSMDSDRELETLTSLSPYYLGAHGGEIYSCLLLRKGEKIKPFLTKMLNSKDNECLARFKNVPVAGMPGAKVSACLSDDLYRMRLKSILKKIENNEWCVIEK